MKIRGTPRTARLRWAEFRPLFPNSKRRLATIAVASFLSGAAEAAVLYLIVRIALAISEGKGSIQASLGPLGDHVTVSVPEMFGVAAVAALLRFSLDAVVAYVTSKLTADGLASLRNDTYSAYINASWDVQSTEKEGHLQDFTVTHAWRVAMALSILASGLSAWFNFLALIVSAVVINFIAALVILFAVVLLFFALRPISRLSRSYARLQAEAGLDYVNAVSETVAMTLEIRTFHVRQSVQRHMRSLVDATVRPFFKNQLMGNVLPTVYECSAILVLLGGLMALYFLGTSTLASLGAIVLILVRALSYSQTLQTVFHRINDLVPYAQGLRTRKAAFEERRTLDDGVALTEIRSLSFRDVSFSYVPDRPVLRGISFKVERGTAVGIIGPSGAGKSTFVQILLRLRSPETGDYLVNGQPASQYSLDDWYRRIAFLPQESRLMSGTVRANICFFREGISHEDVERAAKLAQIHDEISSWPLGYDTPVGPRGGSAVSAGQRQRIALARALVAQPNIIVLDEPTSSLDIRSEMLVHQALFGLRGSVTFFIVAHRLSTLETCDRIMVFTEGRLESFDSANVLATTSPFYRDALARSQFG